MNIETVSNFLKQPVSLRRALFAVTLANTGTALMYSAYRQTCRQAMQIIDDQCERLKIYEETTHFLLDHADDPTLIVLNDKLDYWRVIRGVPPRGDVAEQ